MDLERLSKHQIILLTLLVSFVTSIATGIVTVTLVNQAPPAVTRTINQIVEHTIQTVTPTPQGVAAVTTQKTIVVKDDDLVAQTIANLQKSIIRITAKGSNDLVARGILVDAHGTALTDKSALEASGAQAFEAILQNGTRVAAVVLPTKASSTPFIVLSLAIGTSSGTAPAALGNILKVRLGQSVIRIGGKGVDSVGEGVVAMLPEIQTDPFIEASVQSLAPGSVLATRFGEVIGITTTASLTQSSNMYSTAVIPALAPKVSETKQQTKP